MPSQRYAYSPFTRLSSSTENTLTRHAIQIDYNKFATVVGLKSAASARELIRVTKNKLRDECVLLPKPSSNSIKCANSTSLLSIRYGALSSGLQTSNGATTPKTPTKSGSGTPRATATPASRKRARKSPEKSTATDETDDSEELPAGKKAKATMPAAVDAQDMQVKSEPVLEDSQVSEAEVNFF